MLQLAPVKHTFDVRRSGISLWERIDVETVYDILRLTTIEGRLNGTRCIHYMLLPAIQNLVVLATLAIPLVSSCSLRIADENDEQKSSRLQ